MFRIFRVFNFGHTLQTFGNLMEASLAAVQFQTGLFAGLIKDILAYSSASVVGDGAAASLGLLALLQTKEKLGLVARSAVSIQIIRGTRDSTGRATPGILCETTASTADPIFVSREIYKNSNDSVFKDGVTRATTRRKTLTIQRRVHTGPKVCLKKKKKIRV